MARHRHQWEVVEVTGQVRIRSDVQIDTCVYAACSCGKTKQEWLGVPVGREKAQEIFCQRHSYPAESSESSLRTRGYVHLATGSMVVAVAIVVLSIYYGTGAVLVGGLAVLGTALSMLGCSMLDRADTLDRLDSVSREP